jgi:hypothetical protein
MAISGSDHCNLHRDKAKTLYLKYKTLSDQVDKLVINRKFKSIQTEVDYLMECYICLNQTFKARMKHRMFAFVPECYDEGHDHQFIKLNTLIKDCERKLRELYILQDIRDDKFSTKESESSEEENGILVTQRHVDTVNRAEEYRRFRKQREKEVEEWVQKYIEENEVILERRRVLYTHITFCILKLYEDIDPEEEIHIFVKVVTIFNLCGRLRSIGYFLNTFVPDTCKHPKCACYLPYELTLACGCILHNNTLDKYYNLAPEATLKMFYEVLLFNKAKLLPLLEDICYLHNVYGDQLMFLKLHLVWSQLERRLVIEENNEKPLPKMTTVLATTRLKNKYYQQKLNTMF